MRKIVAIILILLVCIEGSSSYRFTASSTDTNSVYSIELYFDPNGGVSADEHYEFLREDMLPYEIPGRILYTNDGGIEVIAAIYYKAGYTLKSWNTKADGTGENFYPGDIIYSLTDFDEDTLTLYAVWEENGPDTVIDPCEPTGFITWDFWLKLNGNGISKNDEVHFGGTAPDPWYDNSYYDVSYKLPEAKIYQEYDEGKYVFRCWNTEPDGSGKTFEAGYVVHFLSELGTRELYAIWDEVESSADNNTNIDEEIDIDRNTISAKSDEQSHSIIRVIIFFTGAAVIIVIGVIVFVKKRKNLNI